MHIEFSNQRHLEFLLTQGEARSVRRIGSIANLLGTIRRKTDFQNLGETIASDLYTARVIAIQEDHSILGHDIKQPPETEFDLVEVPEDIRMVEFDIIYDHQLRQIMNKLGTLIEEGRIVFVPFDNDIF